MANIKGRHRFGNNNLNRRCSVCRVVKNINDFIAHNQNFLGRGYSCKECFRGISKRYYCKNKERVLERSKKWHILNKEKRKEIVARWRTNNPEKWIEVRKIANLNAKIKRLGLDGKISSADWESLKKKYNWTCPSCKKQEPEVKLTIDHVIPVTKGGDNHVSNLQPLCKSCNSKKYNKVIRY